jgi:hypothetical protein
VGIREARLNHQIDALLPYYAFNLPDLSAEATQKRKVGTRIQDAPDAMKRELQNVYASRSQPIARGARTFGQHDEGRPSPAKQRTR